VRAGWTQVIDILSHSPATAHFIATKLTRRFLADDPPESGRSAQSPGAIPRQ